jgi:hypothetical protein
MKPNGGIGPGEPPDWRVRLVRSSTDTMAAQSRTTWSHCPGLLFSDFSWDVDTRNLVELLTES